MIKVKFIKSPTGRFKLAYSAGQEGRVTPEMAKQLEEAGFIAPLSKRPAPAKESATDKMAAVRETRTPGRKKKQ